VPPPGAGFTFFSVNYKLKRQPICYDWPQKNSPFFPSFPPLSPLASLSFFSLHISNNFLLLLHMHLIVPLSLSLLHYRSLISLPSSLFSLATSIPLLFSLSTLLPFLRGLSPRLPLRLPISLSYTLPYLVTHFYLSRFLSLFILLLLACWSALFRDICRSRWWK